MIETRRPANTIFVITSMPVGGAETLLVNLVRRFDRRRINPFICCLKQRDELGEQVADEIPVFFDLIKHKFDVNVVRRLKRLYRRHEIDAVITVGAGDKMFWGRLAARYAQTPVILSALHSTGWPDGVGSLNRLLTRMTDGFIAVAKSHGRYLIENEGFPQEKVFVIPNGIDTQRFQFDASAGRKWRKSCGFELESPVVGIVAALRQEKNHALFLEAAGLVLKRLPEARFVIVGDGPERVTIETLIRQLNLQHAVQLPGSTQDVPGVLSMMDLFALTSDNEASPVSIMEAMSCQRPVVATDVGSVNELVLDGKTGLLVARGDARQVAEGWFQVLTDPAMAQTMGTAGRRHVQKNCSLDAMTEGYTQLIESILDTRITTDPSPAASETAAPVRLNSI